MNTWRAGCGESRTSGSEGGPGKPTSRKADRAPRSDPYTEHPTREGKLFCAAVLDAFSRRIVGWAMADHLRTELALDALTMALDRRRPAPGLVHHTDRGCQYTAGAYQETLTAQAITVSMSRAGDCYDNALAESFFATLKRELVDTRPWPTRRAARQAIFEWIEVFYNRQRAHSALNYRSPVAFESALAGEAQVA